MDINENIAQISITVCDNRDRLHRIECMLKDLWKRDQPPEPRADLKERRQKAMGGDV